EELSIHPSLLPLISNVSVLNFKTTKLSDSFPDWLQISSRVRHLSMPFTVLPNANYSWEWCGQYLEWLDISYLNLRTLIIPRHCKIRYLKANNNHLDKHLDISQNVLANLSSQSFPTTGMQIRSINMSHNKLSRFVHPILPSLLLLDLSNNSLEGLDSYLLAGLPLLQHFYLKSSVGLFSKCSRISQCWIMSLNQLGNLIDLDISDCNLEWQPDLSNFQTMRKFDLSRNRLSSLDGALLPRNLYYLDVSENLIHYLFNDTCMKNSELREMDISRNPLICHCTLLQIIQWISNDTYSTSTNDLYYCFSGSWQYPLRNYLDSATACLSTNSVWFPVMFTIICCILAISIFLALFIFVANNNRMSHCGKYLSFAYKPLRTSDTSLAVQI
ncbi:unnamed protein product, partial [Wuchereria bancrofti]